MLTSNFQNIIKQCFNDFLNYKSTSSNSVAHPSIPILWFGDVEKYRKSDKKILTIAINPSNKEFSTNGKAPYDISLRFPKANTISLNSPLSTPNMQDYYDAMNSYFKENPYSSWFNNFERPLNYIGASYYPSNDFTRQAIHIDICAPIATDPTWSKLDKSEQVKIESIFGKYFNLLLEELEPDVILVSINEVMQFRSFGLKKVNAGYVSKKYYKGNGFIHGYAFKNKTLITGLNMHGTPFGGMSEDFVEENMLNIKKQFHI